MENGGEYDGDDDEEDPEIARANLQEIFPNTKADVFNAAIPNTSQFDEPLDYSIKNYNKGGKCLLLYLIIV